MARENEYFCYIGENCLDVFVEKTDEIFGNLGSFPRKKTGANDEKEK